MRMLAVQAVLPLAVVVIGAATVLVRRNDSSFYSNTPLRNSRSKESQRSLLDVADLRLFDDDVLAMQIEDTTTTSSSSQPFNPGFEDDPAPTSITDPLTLETEDDVFRTNATNTTNMTTLDAATNDTVEEDDDEDSANITMDATNTTSPANTTSNNTPTTTIPDEDDVEDLDSMLMDDGGTIDAETENDNDEVEEVDAEIPLWNETANITNDSNFTTYYDDDETPEEEEEMITEVPIVNETANVTIPSNISTDYGDDGSTYYDDENIEAEDEPEIIANPMWNETTANVTTATMTNSSNSTGNDDITEEQEEYDAIEEDATAMPSSTPTSPPTMTKLTRPPTLAPTSSMPTFSSTSSPAYESFGPIEYVGNDEEGYFAPYPLGVCQGDCDADKDCAEGLYCFQRHAFDVVPGCAGGSVYSSTADFCVWNATSGVPRPDLPEKYDFGELSYIGNDGTWYDTYPLKVCRGDCDTDNDCAEGLFCFNRVPYQDAPGCSGGGQDDTTVDICVWNTSFPMPEPDPEPPFGAFRLKLYWEEGYRWQNETFERNWCMSYNFDGYPGTGVCWYAQEMANCSSAQVYTALCIDGDPRQWFTFVRLGTTYSDLDEVMIQTVGESPPRCFTRHSSAIYLDTNCDPNNATQRFFAVTGGFREYRFEIGQNEGYTPENCLTNAHHPKSGEVIEFHICEDAREVGDQTSFWELF